MASRTSETVRLLFHARLLVLAVVGVVGVVIAVLAAGGEIGQAQIGAAALPLFVATLGVLAFIGWLGWIDYVSATTLAIDARGVTLGGRTIAWREVRGLSSATGALRLRLRTDAGVARLQLLVHANPIRALKHLVAESTAAGAKVEPYLARLAEHVDEADDAST